MVACRAAARLPAIGVTFFELISIKEITAITDIKGTATKGFDNAEALPPISLGLGDIHRSKRYGAKVSRADGRVILAHDCDLSSALRNGA